jgi:lipopolysaccharide transport system ATP-binding protein
MSAPIVLAEQLGKRYLISHDRSHQRYIALRDVLAHWFAHPVDAWRQRQQRVLEREEFWALRDVSFAVQPGEVVGIIGRNGAGKSTLLKLLSRITEPTSGRLTLGGRVASLLEVGTGFHPELTGRENVFLNGAILGMTRAEIARKFDAIVEFAEVEQFLDTPVKRYSSGMYVRLAFAVAAHLEPDVLVVDEVLAVGDAEFQRRCLGRMREVSQGGRTVFLVSHNMAAIQALCGRIIWLERGKVAYDGRVDEGVSRYLAAALHPAASATDVSVPIGDSLVLRHFDVMPNPVVSGGPLQFVMGFEASAAVRVGELAVLVYSAQEMRVAILDLRSSGLPLTMAGGERRTVRGTIHRLPLVEGSYRLGVYVVTGDFMGNRFGLCEVTVAARLSDAGHAPYASEYRGVVELDFTIEP